VPRAMEVVTLACGHTRRIPYRRIRRRKIPCYQHPEVVKQKVVMRRTVKGLPR
jgi:hypothetical protein